MSESIEESLFVGDEIHTSTEGAANQSTCRQQSTEPDLESTVERCACNEDIPSTLGGPRGKGGPLTIKSNADSQGHRVLEARTSCHTTQDKASGRDTAKGREVSITSITNKPSSPKSSRKPTSPSRSSAVVGEAPPSGEKIDTQHQPMPINSPVPIEESQDMEENTGDIDEDESCINKNLPQVIKKELRELQLRKEEPYCPERDEEDPSGQSHHHLFIQTQKDCANIVNGLIDLFKQAPPSSRNPQQFAELLKSKMKPEPLKPIVVALQGDSGTGKSSVLNSLLNCPGFAPTSSGTKACTNNTAEYTYLFEGQTKPYAVRVYFYELEECRKVISALLEKYVINQEISVEVGSEDYNESAMLVESTIEIFRTLFADRNEFSSDASSHQFLSVATTADDDETLLRMYAWVEELLSGYERVDNIVYLEAMTRAELSKVIQPFIMAPLRGSQELAVPCPWPIVRLVKIGLDSLLLRNGIIIADVPGLSDTNRTRVRNALQYLNRSDFVLVCAESARIETSPEVLRHLTRAHSTHPSARALVVTKTDVFGSHDDLQVNPEEHDTLQEIQQELTRVAVRHRELMDQKKKLPRRKVPSDMHRELEELGEYKALLERLEKGQHMQIRNETIIQAMQTKYRNIFKDEKELPVWCVSSREYSLHLQACDDTTIPVPVAHTGIPALRRSINHLQEKAKVRILQNYFGMILPYWLASAELWSNPSAEGRLAGIRNIVERRVKTCVGNVEEHGDDMLRIVLNSIIVPVRENLDTWKREAKLISDPWCNRKVWNPNTNYAFIRKGGVHRTKKIPDGLNWNQELMRPVVETLEPAWREFDSITVGAYDTLGFQLKDLTKDMKTDLSLSSGGSLIDVDPFNRKITLQRFFIDQFMSEEKGEFRNTSR